MSLTLLRCAAAAASLLLPVSAIAQTPTLDALWPSLDGLSWTYAQHYEEFDATPEVVDNHVRLFFDGTTVAPNGIEAQYLRQELISGAPMVAIAAESGVTDPFLQHLWIARPDLRQRILAKAGVAPCPELGPPAGAYTLLLNGEFAYRKTADEIAAWRCNAADTRSWLWLVADLTTGHEFTLQLVPDLANDIFLHGTVAGVEAVTVPAGTFGGAMRIDYVIDYGVSACTDEFGNPLGTSRAETRGYVHYAPAVGPVKSYEEFIPNAEQTGNCVGPAVGERESLASMALESASTPARRSTWGQIKTAYR